jgi:uncharacterized membrane protein YdbT with pleckstrin-like domain
MEVLWKDRKRNRFGLPWTFTVYELRKDKLLIASGLLSKHEDEVRLYRILDIEWKQGFFQGIFGIGTIVLHSSDKSLGCFEIKNIKESKDVKELLSEQVETARRENRVGARELIGDSDELDEGF